MYLSREEEAMLDGERGRAAEIAMKVLVKLGEAYNAERMIRVRSAHLVSCVYNVVYDAGIDIGERMVKLKARFKVPTTLCTGSVPLEEPGMFHVPKDWVEKQFRLGKLYELMGAIPIWSCIPYWHVNVPRFGENIAWGESNCVSYVNSVIGARTNRYSSYVELCAAITGRVPEMGLHVSENRKGQVLVKLKDLELKRFTERDYGLLGYALGLAVVNEIPVITGIPKCVTKNQLRVMGAAAASSGAIALYHVVGVTPEAHTLERAFHNDKPEEKIEIGKRELKEAYDELCTATEENVDLVALGCPHYSIEQIAKVASLLEGKKVHPNTELWIFTDVISAYLAKRMGYYDIIKVAGGKVMIGSCAMNGPTFVCGFKTVVTDSAKTAHYVPMQAKAGAFYTDLKECIEIAIRGKLR